MQRPIRPRDGVTHTEFPFTVPPFARHSHQIG